MRIRRTLSAPTAVAVAALALTGAPALGASGAEETFAESLTLRPLVDGRVHAFVSFEIDSTRNRSSDSAEGGSYTIPTEHFRLLPRSLIQIAKATGTRELALSLSRGAWDYETWGNPMWWDEESKRMLGEDAVGAGAELWASIGVPRGQVKRTEPLAGALVTGLLGEGSSPELERRQQMQDASPARIAPSVMSRWKSLTASIAGIFCASLDAADETVTQRPFLTRPTSEPLPADEHVETLHAFLPSENICTENLTPLLKMLPCKSSAGLAQLLSPHAVLSSDFHSLSVRLSRETGKQGEKWVVRLSFQAVFSPMYNREDKIISRRGAYVLYAARGLQLTTRTRCRLVPCGSIPARTDSLMPARDRVQDHCSAAAAAAPSARTGAADLPPLASAAPLGGPRCAARAR